MTRRNIGIWLAASALGALWPLGGALAADLPVKAKPIVAATFDWSGVYIGAHAGYGGGMKNWSGPVTDFVARGALVGAQVGINKQIGSFVFGLELDGSWADIGGSQSLTIGGPAAGILATAGTRSKIDGLATFTGRAGLAADRWFVFAKGGLAAAHEKHSLFLNQGPIPANPALSLSVSGAGNETRYAPLLGFGAEYALDGNWSIKGEYDYVHLGDRPFTFTGTRTQNGATGPIRGDLRVEQAIHLVKLGANYRFGRVAVDPAYAPVPPVPGYNWTGAYIGAQGGYGFGGKQWPDFAALGRYDVDGWLAGVNGGVNVQSGVFVFGVEGEWMWTGIRGGRTFASTTLFAPGTVTLDTRIDWLAIASARAGFVVGSNLLLYGKGGVAIAEEKQSTSFASIVGGGSIQGSVSDKPVHTGVVAGAGAEYALGGNWSVKGEYNYIRMFGQAYTSGGTAVVNGPPPAPGTIDFVQPFNKMQQDLHLVKFGVNYHFNPLPVVVAAKY